MDSIIVDFEFTGLDNTYFTDNEIVQCKMLNINSNIGLVENFLTNKPSNIGAFLKHKINNLDSNIVFSKTEFDRILNAVSGGNEFKLFGFSVSQDLSMCKKYGIDLEIDDIMEMILLSDDAKSIIENGRSLESVYYYYYQKELNVSHGSIEELAAIKEVLDKIENKDLSPYYKFMPHGHCAGMPISEYVLNYRRAADGYRYNNNDTLSISLNHEIELLEDEPWF